MTIQHKFRFFLVALGALALGSCTTEKLATQNADDVYFGNVEALPVTYASTSEQDYRSGNYYDRNGYDRNDDYYYDEYSDRSRFDDWNWRNNYTWRDYYYMDRFGYDPFYFGPSAYLGFNDFYGPGWGFSLGFNTPYYGYGVPWYSTSYWNYYGSFYGNSPYWGIYSYYRPGFYGNYYGGYYGYPYYGYPYYGSGYVGTRRNLTPRPDGAYDNRRGSDGTARMPIPDSRATRPTSADRSGNVRTQSDRNADRPYTRPTRTSPGNNGSTMDRRTQGQSERPSSRPTRTETGRSSEPTSRPAPSRPTRDSSPSYSPPSRSTNSSSGSSSSGSSSGSSGRGSSGRPSR
ncbi:hypothetical protein BCY91_07860 [Pelobium manganitolerans]|uniref:Prolyl-tRNA synthetase n=1 Tax=Pelobium manganitolerans TaxID=1842495 RepID=A0A419S423_9SPHI|nr:hypothetical protein [Pelobium manganitolerans]RKD14386.1 hypothetical protein BCY91_07860 [Pelobium manganitolerans]